MGYTVGDLVEVAKESRKGRRDSDGGRAFIHGVKNDNHRGTECEVKCIVGTGNGFSQDVKEERLSPVPMDATARRRQGEAKRPSLLSSHYTPRRSLPVQPTAARSNSVNKSSMINTAKLLEMAKKQLPPPRLNAGLNTLKIQNKKRPKGWLRTVEAIATGKQLNQSEKQLALSLCLALRTVEDTAAANVAFAWGSTRQSIYGWEKKAKASTGLKVVRKVRKDKGKTVFDSEQRRIATFTPQHSFNKQCRAAHRGEPITTEELKEAFATASPETKKRAELQSKQLLQQAPFLVSEIQRVLQLTNGSVTWERLASQLSGGGVQSVCANAIASCVMGLPNSSYQTTRLHPHLSQHHIKNRYSWSVQFWLFWKSAKLMRSNVQIVLVHMDEKWFYAIVIRKNNKLIPFLGVQPVQHQVSHKSHVHKTMAIASTAFIPHDNDMTKGGRSRKVSLVRVGKKIAANEDTFGRVYRDDGTHHCPKTVNNVQRKKGVRHWQPLEITGSSTGTKKKPKFSSLEFFLQIEIPKLERICREVFTLVGVLAIIRYQMDGAGPHRDQALLDRLDYEFNKRGWTFKFQPSQSPLTNIKDACIFPAMSKEVTAAQGIKNGSHYIEGEDLWQMVKDCWKEFPEETIARAFTGHHQIVNAIAKCKGGDQFAKEHKGLHCGIRKHCVPYFDNEEGGSRPSGVEMIETLDATGMVSPNQLKYEQPKIDGTGITSETRY